MTFRMGGGSIEAACSQVSTVQPTIKSSKGRKEKEGERGLGVGIHLFINTIIVSKGLLNQTLLLSSAFFFRSQKQGWDPTVGWLREGSRKID